MKSSELIKILQDHTAKHGDSTICINHWGAIYFGVEVKSRQFLDEQLIDITPPKNADLTKK